MEQDVTGIDSRANQRRERRRRRKSTAGSRSRAMQFDRRLLMIMLSLLFVYIGVGLLRAQQQDARYGSIALGMSHNAVRYVKGPPEAKDAANQRWSYEEGGTITTVNFAGDSVSSSSCELPVKDLIACPAVFGIGAGATAADLLHHLGPPDESRLTPEGKEMTYDGLGYSFLLREETVIRITHQPRGTLSDFLRDSLWQLIP